MQARRIFIIITTLLLIAGVTTGVIQALDSQPALRTTASLENVRAYAPAPTTDGAHYAVEGGALFAGEINGDRWTWSEVRTPSNVIVASVAIDAHRPDSVYIGAANELAIYRTTNQGRDWQRIPLVETDAVMTGGVVALAVDPVQRLVFAGTDTAGLFRLRDVGSSLTLTARLLTEEPVREIVVDLMGKGVLFARTDWTLYRGENHGLAWVTVNDIRSAPTALAISVTGEETPVVYVGTMDRGVVRSLDGHNWATDNEGLNFVPGSRLHVDAMAVDPAQPETLYIATSYLYGSTDLQSTPSTVFVHGGFVDGDSVAWTPIGEAMPATAAALLPVSGQPGAVYALTATSRTPLALGSAPVMMAAGDATVVAPPAETSANWTAVLAWVVAALAAGALIFAVVTDLRRRPTPVRERGTLAEQPVTNHR